MEITIEQAISYFDEQCANQYSQEDKIKWLNELDSLIYEEIVSPRENAQITSPPDYSEDNTSQTLIVGTPYTEIYRYWLQAKVDFANRELTMYNNAMVMYNQYYEQFFAYYNRNHRVKGHKKWIM